MARRYFNWKLAVVLVVGLTVLSVTVYALRQWQKMNKAERGLVLGNEAYQQQRYKDAADYLGRYVGVYQDDVPALLKYADAHLNIRPLRRNNVQQAIGSYHIVLRVDPANREAARRLVGLHLEMGMPGEAEAIARKYLETTDDPEIRRLLAIALASQRKVDEAIEQLENIIAAEPNQVLAYEALGQLAERFPTNFDRPAEYWFDQAVKNNPSAALAYAARASFHLRNGNNEKALADLQKAEQMDLSEVDLRLRIAAEFITAGALDEAQKHLELVRKHDPKNQALWRMWAQIALNSQAKKKMLEVAEAGLKELAGQPWDFMPLAAELFAKGGNLVRATECINELDKADINPAMVASLRGLVASKRGEMRDAVKYWRQTIELGIKSPQVRLALAQALIALGDNQSALRQLRLFLSEWPNSFEGHLTMAKLLANAGDWAGAAEHARRARELSGENEEAVLLSLKARTQLLADSPEGGDDQAWSDIEQQLSSLKSSAKDPLKVELLRLQVAVQREKFDQAHKILATLKQQHPSHFRVSIAECGLLTAEGKEDQAIETLEATIEEFPDAAEPVRFLAMLLDRQDNRSRCERIIKQALERIADPQARRELNLLLVQFYNRWRRGDDAYSLLTELAAKEPNSIQIKRLLLNSERIAKEPQKAQQLIEQIKALEGEDGWQWRYEQARAWFNGHDFDRRSAEIVSLLQNNLLANPDDQDSRFLLAQTYERSGNLQMALATYREALARSPDDVQLIIKTVSALYDAGEYDEAEEIMKRISKEKLEQPALRQLQFRSFLRRGQLSSAADILEQYLGADPNNISVNLSLALLKMQQNQFDEARQLLDDLQAREPNSLPVKVARIQLSVRENKPNEALDLCNQIIADQNDASAYIIRARTYITLGDLEKAGDDLDRAVAADPNAVNAWLARSDFYKATGRLEKAMADIDHALTLDADNPEVQIRAVGLFLASGKRNKARQARAIVDKALESNPDNLQLKLLKAETLAAEGTAPAIQNAVKFLRKLTEQHPRLTRAWAMLAEILSRQGQSGKAIDVVLQGLVHNPQDRTLLMMKAQAEAAKSPFLAVATLKQLLDLDPNDVSAAIRLSEAYTATGNADKAVALMKNLLPGCRQSDRRRCKLALAIALHTNGQVEQAQKEFDSLLAEDPNDPAPLFAQVQLLSKEKAWTQIEKKTLDWYKNHPQDLKTPSLIAGTLARTADDLPRKAAENIFQILLKDHPRSAEVAASLAVLMQVTERYEQAAKFYRRVLELRPDDVVALNNLAWIISEQQGAYQEALELAQKGLKIAPNYVDLIDTRGVVYYRLGKFDKAVQDFSTCIKLYPDENASVAAVHFHLGRALARLGENEKAREHLNRALSLNQKVKGLSQTDLSEVKHLLEKLAEEGGK